MCLGFAVLARSGGRLQRRNPGLAASQSSVAEIAALEQRLAKTGALKQGMMQEPLTGRIACGRRRAPLAPSHPWSQCPQRNRQLDAYLIGNWSDDK
jgi:hypothetical protein